MKLTVSLLMAAQIQRMLKGCNGLLCFVVRLVGGAKTSLRRHGELGAERLRGAEDPIGC